MQQDKLQDRACGRWTAMLPALGVPAAYLVNRHGPCPMCGGKDRFRYDDRNGTGSYFCNGCGAGDGVDLVMRANKIDFNGAKKLIDAALPNAAVQIKRAADPGRNDFKWYWQQCLPVTRYDPVGKYLARRGLAFPNGYPSEIRYHPAAKYIHADKSITQHPAMVGRMLASDASDATYQTTYLDAEGHKATVPDVRRFANRGKPETINKKLSSSSVRLAYSAETMGVAEGIETALAAQQMFDVPVWAVLTAGAMCGGASVVHWCPPETVKHVIIFGDSDAGYVGQAAAYNLARVLIVKHKLSAEVRLPDHIGDDWNGVLQSEQRGTTLEVAA